LLNDYKLYLWHKNVNFIKYRYEGFYYYFLSHLRNADVTTIGIGAFLNCGSLTSIGANAFPTAIYTLDGAEVKVDVESLKPGVYVIRQGGKGRKIVVK
jgi:hypothetical protein